MIKNDRTDTDETDTAVSGLVPWILAQMGRMHIPDKEYPVMAGVLEEQLRQLKQWEPPLQPST